MKYPAANVLVLAAWSSSALMAAPASDPKRFMVHDRASWFEAADRNDDSQLSREEFRDFRMNTMGRDVLAQYRSDRRAASQSPIDHSFRQLDRDNNGMITVTEFANAPTIIESVSNNTTTHPKTTSSTKAEEKTGWWNPDYITATYYLTVSPVDADVLEGKPVVNLKGERVGRIDRIVRTKEDNRYYAMIDIRGTPIYQLTGTSRDEAGVPLDDVMLFRDGSSIMLSSHGEEWLRTTEAREIENPETVERLWSL